MQVQEPLPQADIHEYYRKGKTNLRVHRERALSAADGSWPVTNLKRSTLLHFHDKESPCGGVQHEFYPKQEEETQSGTVLDGTGSSGTPACIEDDRVTHDREG